MGEVVALPRPCAGEILDSDAYPGSTILEKAGPADAAPSLSGGWDFTVAYFQAVWQALVAALLISAGVLTLIPRERVVRALSRGRWPTVTAGLWSMPSMMSRRSVPDAEIEPGEGTVDDRPLVARYFRALARLTVVLVPEYLVVVFIVGALRGWLFPFDGGAADWAILTVIGAAIVGTVVVIPTAGEIPILTGLSAAGAGAGLIGALLIVLPAICLPSIVMVGRTLGWRVTAAMAGGVAATGLVAATMLGALGG